MMIRLLLLAGIACLARSAPAQNLSTSLIGSAGGHQVSATFGSLDWSVGEPMASLFSPGGPVLSQGFHQVFVSLVTSTQDGPDIDAGFVTSVYPNPSSDWIRIMAPEAVRIRLWSVMGVDVISPDEWAMEHRLIITGYPAGTYLLEIIRSGNAPSKFYQIQLVH